MKKKLLICLSVLFVGGVILLLLTKFAPFEVLPDILYQGKEKGYIAVAGPMSGYDKAWGEAMLKGARLYLDKKNKDKKFNRKIELLIFNDKNSRSGALNAASSIVNGDKALLVIGHYSSLPSVAAGEVYQKNGIPAITASATNEHFVLSNEWYFRIIPSNRFQAGFAANYINEVLEKKSASIISEKGDYGAVLAEGFEQAARNMGMTIKKKWEIDPDDKNLDEELKKIINEIRATNDPGALFFATHADKHVVKIITSIKYPGTDYIIIGPDDFSDPLFLRNFERYPTERRQPGYYSDGIYALSPFIADIAGEKARIFRNEFLEKYNEEPSWAAASYYDAMHVAVTAIEHAEIYGEDIRKNRRKLRDTLAAFNSSELAIKGVTGDIFFDTTGNMLKPLMTGFYERHNFLPTFSQYQTFDLSGSLNDNKEQTIVQKPTPDDDDVEEQKPTPDDVEEQKPKTRVVYAGIDINGISNLNVVNRTYTIDFYIWFRFQGSFDDTHIKFVNAAHPIHLGPPIVDMYTEKDVMLRTYRVKADFKADFDLYTYSFDHHTLNISLHHTDMKRTELIYIPDIRSMYQAREKKDIGKTMFHGITGWHINEIAFYQNVAKVSASDNKTTDFSQFNAAVQIKRKELNFIFKHLFLPIAIIVLLYFVYFLPSHQISIRIIFTGSLIIAEIYRLVALSGLAPGYIAIEYVFFTAYLLGGISAFISISIYMMHKRGADEGIRRLTRAGKIIHPSIILIAGLLIAHSIVLASDW